MYTRLGENLERLDEADAIAAHYLEVIDKIVAAGITGEVSVKPTQLGLDLDPEVCLAHLVRHRGAGGGRRLVPLDRHGDRAPTSSDHRPVRTSARRPAATGICLQAYLRRTADDIERLLPLDPAIRLVKGAYDEPESIAYESRRSIDASYLGLAVAFLLESRGRPIRLGLGTHDVGADRADRRPGRGRGIGKDGFEVEMLYGIRTDQQLRLARGRLQGPVSLIAYGEYWYPWYMRSLAERPANVWFAMRQMLPL